ncbi:DUF6600 domain-containing protein, partial [Emcibacter sp. SYSU 3D8]|uniref:DUF6600 domain-containing protein n=1 Tax=Emcibacter sp. SYSU 3D8 TaxID=3133969 RepID=UPI0031FE487C
MSQKSLIAAAFVAGAMLLPGAAIGATAYIAESTALRAGPDDDYPVVRSVREGRIVNVYGCLADWSFCDVSVRSERGWIDAEDLLVDYRDRRRLLADVGPYAGIGQVSFRFGSYWDSYYRGLPFYMERGRWERYHREHGQDNAAVGFDSFHRALAPYGDWVYSDRWGPVWIPRDVDRDFHPYATNGRWVSTREYGFTWVSYDDWGDIPFHYGRWVNDPYDGWLWIPGYVWSPGWVIWRSNDRYIGWMPMPPDEEFIRGDFRNEGRQGSLSIGIHIDLRNTRDYYGYRQWYGNAYNENLFSANWVFISPNRIVDRDYRRYAVESRPAVVNILNNTTNITNYKVVNNYVVNASIDVAKVERSTGKRIEYVNRSEITKKPDLITKVEAGRETQTRVRQRVPQGAGLQNSAPKPSAEVVKGLSTQFEPRKGRVEPSGKNAHRLYTRETVRNAPLPPQVKRPSTPDRAKPGAGVSDTPAGDTAEERRARTRPDQARPGAVKPPGTKPDAASEERRSRARPEASRPGVTPPPDSAPADAAEERRSRARPEAAQSGTSRQPDSAPADAAEERRSRARPEAAQSGTSRQPDSAP